MKKPNEKSAFTRYKVFWENGKAIAQSNLKVGTFVKNYAINSIYSSFKTDKSAINEKEKKELEQMIRELAEDKKKLGAEAKVSQEEYVEFLGDCFDNIDDEDRHGEVNLQTSASFRMLGDLIDILTTWAPLPEDWNKKKKYCKFKAVDIFKSLKAGLVPKRGGPKEEENGENKELNSLIDENDKQFKDNSEINNSNTNSKPAEIINKNINSKPVDDKNQSINNSNKINTDQQSNSNIIKTNSKPSFNINYIVPDADFDINRRNVATSIDFQKQPTTNQGNKFQIGNINSSLLGSDFKLDCKLAKKLDFKLPVKFKSMDYFRLCDVIKKQVDSASREIQSNKTDMSLKYIENAYYYLHQIQIKFLIKGELIKASSIY